MKKTLIIASAAAVAMMASGSSFAASKSTTMNFSFVVAGTCDIYLSTTDTINQTDVHDIAGEGWDDNLGVLCSEDLPYIVEASTDANGQVMATSATSAREYPVTLYRGLDTVPHRSSVPMQTVWLFQESVRVHTKPSLCRMNLVSATPITAITNRWRRAPAPHQ